MAEIGVDLNRATNYLIRGHLVAIPTETVYGLAANALNQQAVLRVFEVKNRPRFDPLIIHTDSFDKLSNYVEDIPDTARLLNERFWPGPLTLILKKNEKVNPLITSGLDTAAFRIPNHQLTLDLLKRLEFPLVAPSANPFGYISPTNPEHVNLQLGDKIDYILDGGDCDLGIESTIISLANEIPEILRLGSTPIEPLKDLLGDIKVNPHSSSQPTAPGMLSTHYAPSKKLLLGNIEKLVLSYNTEKVGLLSFKTSYDLDVKSQLILSEKGDLKEAASNLFKYLRIMEELPIQVIIAEPVPEHGLGRAINDRLKRAAVNT